MQAQTAELTLGEVSDRLDRSPASRFHAKILIVAALSLLFEPLDTAVTGFVLASLRTAWHFDRRRLRRLGPSGCPVISWGSAICGFIADHVGRKKTDLVHSDFVLPSSLRAEGYLTRSAYLPS